jgi:hypothetical protein
MPKAKLSARQSSCPTATAPTKSDAAAASFEVHHRGMVNAQVRPDIRPTSMRIYRPP